MRPTADEFVHARSSWRSEAHGFSIEVRWGGFSTEEPNGHWWWSVMVSEDQLSVSGFLSIRRQAIVMMEERYIDAIETVHMTRSVINETFTDTRYVKMSKRSVGLTAWQSEEEARAFCLFLLSRFPGRKVWDQSQKKYI